MVSPRSNMASPNALNIVMLRSFLSEAQGVLTENETNRIMRPLAVMMIT